MPARLVQARCEGPPQRRRAPLPRGAAVRISWLGQAGFVLDGPASRIVIDPYLSDSLAEKYRGTRFPHARMMPPPIEASQLRDVDWILSTHAHTDHLDPGTLPQLAAANPQARFLVNRASCYTAVERGVPEDRLVLCNAGEVLELGSGDTAVGVTVTPAAHEARERDDRGDDRYVGYVLDFGKATVYHSGDTVPLDALDAHLSLLRIDCALLPVNGRDEARRADGVPGNLTLDEAVDLVLRHKVPILIGHHFDLFDFNTIDRAWGEQRLRERTKGADRDWVLAATGLCYHIEAAYSLGRGDANADDRV